MKNVLVAVALAAAFALGGCWVPVQAAAPSDNIVFVVEQQVGLFPTGRVTRCEGPGQCVEYYSP